MHADGRPSRSDGTSRPHDRPHGPHAPADVAGVRTSRRARCATWEVPAFRQGQGRPDGEAGIRAPQVFRPFPPRPLGGRSGGSPAPPGAAGDPFDQGAHARERPAVHGGRPPTPRWGRRSFHVLRGSAQPVRFGPEGVDASAHCTGTGRREPGDLVPHRIVPEAPQATALASSATADLAAPLVVRRRRRGGFGVFANGLLESRSRLRHAVLSRSRLCRSRKAGGEMGKVDRALVLVPMLTSSSGPREPSDRKVLVAQAGERRPPAVEDGHGHRGRVDPSAVLGRGDALDAMGAGLVSEAGDSPLGLDDGCAVHRTHAVQSAGAVQHARVCLGEFVGEQAGVVAAFAGADLYGRHVIVLPCMSVSDRPRASARRSSALDGKDVVHAPDAIASGGDRQGALRAP